MKKDLYAICVMATLSSGCTSAQFGNGQMVLRPMQQPLGVPLVRLLANPLDYHGVKIRVIGFYTMGFEESSLSLHEQWASVGDARSSIWVHLPEELSGREILNEQYLLLEGVFDAHGGGHMGVFSGELKDVSRVRIWYTPLGEDLPFFEWPEIEDDPFDWNDEAWQGGA